MRNPALRARGQDVRIVLFGGAATTVKGVVANLETTASEAGQAFAEAGAIAWLDYGGDGQQIEFLEYVDLATGDRMQRRSIKAERVGTVFAVVKVNMVRDGSVMSALSADFDSRDWGPDFYAG